MTDFEKLGEALERKGIEVDWVDDDSFYLIANYTDVNGKNEKVDILVEVDSEERGCTNLSVDWYDYLRQADARRMMGVAVHSSSVKTVGELVDYIEDHARQDGIGLPIWENDPASLRTAVNELSRRVSIMERDMEELVSAFRDFLRNDANERRIMRRSTPTRNRYRR